MKAILLLALCCMGCATAHRTVTPEVPRIECVNVGRIPDSAYWLYACVFNGPADSTLVLPPPDPSVTALGET